MAYIVFSGTCTTRYFTLPYLLSYNFIGLNEASRPNIDWLVICSVIEISILRHNFSSNFYDMSRDVS